MPLLKLHFQEELVSVENFEDLLLQVNKDPSANFKSRDEWMRSILRNYTVTSINSLRRWQTTRYITTLQGRKHIPTLKFWKGDVESLDDGEEEGILISIPIGKLQHDYLRTCVYWENTYQKEILLSEIVHESIAALSRFILLNALLAIQAQVDEEKLKEEELEVLEEEAETEVLEEPELEPDRPLDKESPS